MQWTSSARITHTIGADDQREVLAKAVVAVAMLAGERAAPLHLAARAATSPSAKKTLQPQSEASRRGLLIAAADGAVEGRGRGLRFGKLPHEFGARVLQSRGEGVLLE